MSNEFIYVVDAHFIDKIEEEKKILWFDQMICFCSIAMVMADVTVLTDLWQEEEKRIKKLLETLGQKMKDHGVSILMKISLLLHN